MFKLKNLKSKLLFVCFKLIKANEMINSLFMILFMTGDWNQSWKSETLWCHAIQYNYQVQTIRKVWGQLSENIFSQNI